MHVGIEQTGDQVTALSLDDLRLLTDHRIRIGTTVGNPAPQDGDICVLDDLARADVHPAAVTDDQIGRPAAHHHGNQFACCIVSRCSSTHVILKRAATLKRGQPPGLYFLYGSPGHGPMMPSAAHSMVHP